jgi:hypothetical protein
MTVSGLMMIKTSRQFFQSWERTTHKNRSRRILSRERCSGQDQGPDEQKESGDEDHKSEANHRKKDEPDDRAEWLMISLTASISRPDEIFGTDR